MALCTCGHRKHTGRCEKPVGPGNGKARMVCYCPVYRAASPQPRKRDGQPSGKTWTTRQLRCGNFPGRDKRRAEERARHGQKGRRQLENKTRLSPAGETAVERMRRMLRGEGY